MEKYEKKGGEKSQVNSNKFKLLNKRTTIVVTQNKSLKVKVCILINMRVQTSKEANKDLMIQFSSRN